MKKIIPLLLSLLLILSLALPVAAVTPTLQPPDLPEVPDISGSVHVELPDKVFDDWFEDNPAPILKPVNFKPVTIELQPVSRPSWWEWLVDKYT